MTEKKIIRKKGKGKKITAIKPAKGTIIKRPDLIKYSSAEELQVLIDAYFKYCDKHDEPYTITGLGVACGLDRSQLIQYSKKDIFYDTIKTAKRKCQAYAEKQLFRSSGQVAGIIFSMKNNYGWKDEQTHKVGPSDEIMALVAAAVTSNSGLLAEDDES